MAGPSQGGGWGGFSPPIFGRSAKPILTRGDTLSPPSTTSPPGFSDLVTTLSSLICPNCLIFLASGDRPSDGCSYDVFDYFTNDLIKNATAIYRANEDILKLSNVNTEMPYYLKFNGTDIPNLEFYLLTNSTHLTSPYFQGKNIPEQNSKSLQKLSNYGSISKI